MDPKSPIWRAADRMRDSIADHLTAVIEKALKDGEVYLNKRLYHAHPESIEKAVELIVDSIYVEVR